MNKILDFLLIAFASYSVHMVIDYTIYEVLCKDESVKQDRRNSIRKPTIISVIMLGIIISLSIFISEYETPMWWIVILLCGINYIIDKVMIFSSNEIAKKKIDTFRTVIVLVISIFLIILYSPLLG